MANSQETNSETSAKCGKLRDEYRRRVQSQISQDLTESMSSIKLYQEQLVYLCDQLQEAKKQVTGSVINTEMKICETFDEMLMSVKQVVKERRAKLLNDVNQMKMDAISPLEECEKVLIDRLKAAEEKLSQGNRLVNNGGGAVTKDTILRFQEAANNMTSLPAVPALCAVPCISIEFPLNPPVATQVCDLIQTSGKLYRMGPVQITSIQERPGALFVTWEEVDDDVAYDGVEFCLQCSSVGETNSQVAKFNTVYEGQEFSFLLRDIIFKESYMLRVSSKKEGSGIFGPWSLVQSASTHIPHFSWSCNTPGWSVVNSGRLASKVTNDSDILQSSSNQVYPGTSVLFKVLSTGEGCSNDGVGLSCHPIDKFDELSDCGTLFVNSNGSVFLDGNSRLNKLPAMTEGSQVIFTIEEANRNKVRVYIEIQDKQVTYEWTVPSNQNKFYFIANFGEPKWTISVH